MKKEAFKINSIFGSQANIEEYLIEHILSDIEVISTLLNWHDNPKQAYMWILKALGDFAGKFSLISTFASANTEEERIDFEKNFEAKIIFPLFDNKTETLLNYENCLSTLANSHKYITANQLLNEQKKDGNYKYIEFFKIQERPSYEHLLKCHKEVKDIYPLINILNDFKEHDVGRLSCILPIVRLTSFLLETYNYRITKAKAKDEILDTKRYPILGTLLSEFREAWANAKFHLEIQYFGNKIRNNPKLGQSPYLKDYLIDDTEESGKLLLAGITELCHIQNSLLGYFNGQLEINVIGSGDESQERVIDKTMYPVHALFPHDIVNFEDKYATIINRYSFYSHLYNKNVIYYDFEGIENWIILNLLDKKIIDINKFEKINYQGDILGGHTLIELMKEKIELTELDKYEQSLVKSICNVFTQERNYEHIQEIMNALESIMYFIQDSAIPPPKETSIKEFGLQKFGNEAPVTRILDLYNDIGAMMVSKIVYIYEQIELLCFDFLVEFLPGHLKNTSDQHEIESEFLAFMDKLNELDQLEQFAIAIKRFILRGLQTVPDGKLKICDYIFHLSLWDNYKKINELKEHFPKDLLIENALAIHKIVDYQVSKKLNNSLIRRASYMANEAQVINSALDIGANAIGHEGAKDEGTYLQF